MTRADDAFARALNADHVAIFGASATPGKWGYNVVDKLLADGYEGRLTLVNPRGGTAFGRPLVDASHAKGADLAVISTPAPTVPGIIEQLAELGIGAAVVEAGGFNEVGNAELDGQLRKAISDTGVRVIGPNCVGFYSSPNKLNVTTMPGFTRGGVSFVSQSGGLAQQVARRLTELGSGFDVLMALGNKIDVGFTDSLRALGERPSTQAILLYLERLDEGEAFLDLLSELSQQVPVVALLAGRTTAGQSAARSHTGSIISRWDRVAGLLRDSGVVVEERLELAAAAVAGGVRRQRVAVKKVYVLCDGGGHSVLLADGLERAGFTLVRPSADLAAKLATFMGEDIAGVNPLDLQGRADRDPSIYAPMLETVLDSGEYDAAVIGGMFGGYRLFFDEQLGEVELGAARRIAERAAKDPTPVVVQTVYATEDSEALTVLRAAGVPAVEWPSETVAVLRARTTALGDSAARTAAHAPDAADRELAEQTERIVQVLDRAGIAHGIGHLVERDALPTSDPGPWVLRLDAFAHKVRIGGIEVGLSGEQLPAAWDRLAAVARKHGTEPLIRVGPLVRHDEELIVSLWRDGREGSGWMVGAGGTDVEEDSDVAVGRLPKTAEDARNLLFQTNVGQRLRDQKPAHVERFAESAMLLAQLFTSDLSDLRELEVNPVALWESGAAVLDALPYR
ncbi:MAG: hypothetical protein QOH61_2307 [Chloroflexota bacterium]|nr:hypothetical protein [Chloroflexota bacterium]